MITAALPSTNVPSLEGKPSSPVSESPEYQRARSRLELYLRYLGFDDEARFHVVDQVMSRAVACGTPQSSIQNALHEVHRCLASRAQPDALPYSEGSALWGSVEWRASASLASLGDKTLSYRYGQTPFGTGRDAARIRILSMPPIERRHMVPKTVEYLSCRHIGRSILAWVRDKLSQPEFSLGKIPPK
jgi:hypothetical protein